jgi:hypothetical protein
MSDDAGEDGGDASEELGETADKIGGIADRFNQSDETTETTETAETSETTSLPGDDVVVREDWNGRTIYLSDALVDEVEDAYGRYYGAFRTEHGRELAKNRDLYPAIFRSALRGTSMEEELGLVDEANNR